MTKQFGEWLADKYDVRVRDMSETKFPWFWKWISSAKGLTTKGENVFLTNLDDLKPSTKNRRLVHEVLGHIRKQRQVGWKKYKRRYILSPRFRMEDEVEAYAFSMEYRHMLKQDITDYPRNVANLLRSEYLIGFWNRKKALKKLKRKRDLIIAGQIRTVRDLYDEWRRQ